MRNCRRNLWTPGWRLALILSVLAIVPVLSGCGQVIEVRLLGSPTWAPPAVTAPATADLVATVEAAVAATNTVLAQTPQLTATRPATPAIVTRTPRPPTATPLSTRAWPTATPTPQPTATATPWPEPTRIYFASGATSTSFRGDVRRGEYVLYVLRALGSQTMTVVVTAPAGGVTYSLWGADGTVLKPYAPEQPEWTGELPATQDYFLHVVSIRDTGFTVSISIPPLVAEPFIEVLSPKGGEQWKEGETYSIVWASSGVDRVDLTAASGGRDLGLIASALEATAGQYTWLIPTGLISNFGSVKSDTMRLRIADHANAALHDENDNPFSVLVPRIQFAPGGTSASVNGYVRRSSSYRYVLRALADQVMEVVITSPDGNVALGVRGLDGTLLKSSADGRNDWRGTLPSTQDYLVEAAAMGTDTAFQLLVRFPVEDTEPTRIQFAPGATSATQSGHVTAGDIDRYVFRALAGQNTDIQITGGDLALELMGEDGILLRHHLEGSRQWSGQLPFTQDYVISVVSTGASTDYELVLRIEPLAATPTRIQFQAGTTWATVGGELPAGGSQTYILRALGGQTMHVSVLSPGNSVGLSVWGADGSFLKWYGDGVPAWRGQLPATQDYYLEVITTDASSYSLTVEIPPL
jgi:hypothetical protein